MKRIFFIIIGTAVLLMGAGGVAVATSDETIAPDLQVNTYTAGNQVGPAVAMGPDGRFIIAWSSKDQDGDGYGVYGQRYDSSGHAIGAEFQVNTYVTGNQYDPSVAVTTNGNFVITWSSNGQHGDWWGIYGQRYDSSGNAVGAEFQVNTYDASLQDRSSVAMDGAGNFVITWSSHKQDGDGWGVYGQRYDSSGSAVGTEFQVNTHTAGLQEGSSVAMDAQGNFVIAWVSRNKEDDGWGIYGQRYDRAGNPVGAEFEVNTYPAGDRHHHRTSVAMGPNGNSAIAWASHLPEDDWWSVYAQLYNSFGNKIGYEFKVNSYTKGTQFRPSIAMDADGGFVVAWTSISPEGSGWGVYAQRFDSTGLAVDQEFQVNSQSTKTQSNPSAAMDANGNVVIAWTSKDQDGDGYGLFMRKFPF